MVPPHGSARYTHALSLRLLFVLLPPDTTLPALLFPLSIHVLSSFLSSSPNPFTSSYLSSTPSSYSPSSLSRSPFSVLSVSIAITVPGARAPAPRRALPRPQIRAPGLGGWGSAACALVGGAFEVWVVMGFARLVTASCPTTWPGVLALRPAAELSLV
jgi:hypothetical protein